MKKLVNSLAVLILCFGFLVLSESGAKPIKPDFSTGKYIFSFSSSPFGVPYIYKILFVSQTQDYLLFDIERMSVEELKYRNNKECYFKKVLSKSDLETIETHSKLIFSMDEIKRFLKPDNSKAPLPYHIDPSDPIDPVAPLPAPLPYHIDPSDPIDPVAPLPAPLPYHIDPSDPIDPVAPLPAPLPYYVIPHSEEYIVLHRNQNGVTEKVIVLDSKEWKWSNKIAPVLIKYFQHLKACSAY